MSSVQALATVHFSLADFDPGATECFAVSLPHAPIDTHKALAPSPALRRDPRATACISHFSSLLISATSLPTWGLHRPYRPPHDSLVGQINLSTLYYSIYRLHRAFWTLPALEIIVKGDGMARWYAALGMNYSASYDADPSTYSSLDMSTGNSSTRYVRTHPPPTPASGPVARLRHSGHSRLTPQPRVCTKWRGVLAGARGFPIKTADGIGLDRAKLDDTRSDDKPIDASMCETRRAAPVMDWLKGNTQRKKSRKALRHVPPGTASKYSTSAVPYPLDGTARSIYCAAPPVIPSALQGPTSDMIEGCGVSSYRTKRRRHPSKVVRPGICDYPSAAVEELPAREHARIPLGTTTALAPARLDSNCVCHTTSPLVLTLLLPDDSSIVHLPIPLPSPGTDPHFKIDVVVGMQIPARAIMRATLDTVIGPAPMAKASEEGRFIL
ncbi:hypothetical protein VTO73DRAFT_1611 [Trametes versicolor]